jgi:hypothetical protein
MTAHFGPGPQSPDDYELTDDEAVSLLALHLVEAQPSNVFIDTTMYAQLILQTQREDTDRLADGRDVLFPLAFYLDPNYLAPMHFICMTRHAIGSPCPSGREEGPS